MSTKRYKDGDRLHAGVFNKLLNDVENLEYDVDELKRKKDNNTWRPIKINNKDVLGKEITTPLNLLSGDKAYLGYTELTTNNAFIGTVPVIDEREQQNVE